MLWTAGLAALLFAVLPDRRHPGHAILLLLLPATVVSAPSDRLAALHTPWPIIHLAQAASTLLVSCLVWRGYSTGLHGTATLLVCAASLLVTPHGSIYDMPALCKALLLFVDRDRATVLQQLVALAAQMVPIVVLAIRIPFVSPALLAILVLSLSALPRRSTLTHARLGPVKA